MAKIEYTILARNVRKTMNARGDISMELAKVTSKGQITIPVEIRKRLKLKDGDKVLFMEDDGQVYIMNSSMDALRETQKAFVGKTEKAGFASEEDGVNTIRELR